MNVNIEKQKIAGDKLANKLSGILAEMPSGEIKGLIEKELAYLRALIKEDKKDSQAYTKELEKKLDLIESDPIAYFAEEKEKTAKDLGIYQSEDYKHDNKEGMIALLSAEVKKYQDLIEASTEAARAMEAKQAAALEAEADRVRIEENARRLAEEVARERAEAEAARLRVAAAEAAVPQVTEPKTIGGVPIADIEAYKAKVKIHSIPKIKEYLKVGTKEAEEINDYLVKVAREKALRKEGSPTSMSLNEIMERLDMPPQIAESWIKKFEADGLLTPYTEGSSINFYIAPKLLSKLSEKKLTSDDAHMLVGEEADQNKRLIRVVDQEGDEIKLEGNDWVKVPQPEPVAKGTVSSESVSQPETEMSLEDLDAFLNKNNIELRLKDNETLELEAEKGIVTDYIRGQIKKYKPELIKRLQVQEVTANQEEKTDLAVENILKQLQKGSTVAYEEKIYKIKALPASGYYGAVEEYTLEPERGPYLFLSADKFKKSIIEGKLEVLVISPEENQTPAEEVQSEPETATKSGILAPHAGQELEMLKAGTKTAAMMKPGDAERALAMGFSVKTFADWAGNLHLAVARTDSEAKTIAEQLEQAMSHDPYDHAAIGQVLGYSEADIATHAKRTQEIAAGKIPLTIEADSLEEGLNRIRQMNPSEDAQKPETKTFSTDFVKNTILSTIEGKVDEIRNPNIEGKSGTISLSTTIVKDGYEISVRVILENNQNTIGVRDYAIEPLNANFFTESTVQARANQALVPEINKIPELLKSKIEEKRQKKIEKIKIENGELKVTFMAVAPTQETETNSFATDPEILKQMREEAEKERERNAAIEKLKAEEAELEAAIRELQEKIMALPDDEPGIQELPQDLKGLINDEIDKYESQLKYWEDKNEEDMIKFCRDRIEIIKSNPIKYFTELKQDAEGMIEYVSTEESYTLEQRQNYLENWKMQTEKYEKIISGLKANIK